MRYTPGMTSTLEDMVAKLCFMLEPEQNQKSNIKMTDQNVKPALPNIGF
jgi:hypothetical protein